jgi:hypothetical protein
MTSIGEMTTIPARNSQEGDSMPRQQKGRSFDEIIEGRVSEFASLMSRDYHKRAGEPM